MIPIRLELHRRLLDVLDADLASLDAQRAACRESLETLEQSRAEKAALRRELVECEEAAVTARTIPSPKDRR